MKTPEYSRETFERAEKTLQEAASYVPETDSGNESYFAHRYQEALRKLEELKALGEEEAREKEEKYKELREKAVAALRELAIFEEYELDMKPSEEWLGMIKEGIENKQIRTGGEKEIESIDAEERLRKLETEKVLPNVTNIEKGFQKRAAKAIKTKKPILDTSPPEEEPIQPED